jgi:hypothetical protein
MKLTRIVIVFMKGLADLSRGAVILFSAKQRPLSLGPFGMHASCMLFFQFPRQIRARGLVLEQQESQQVQGWLENAVSHSDR